MASFWILFVGAFLAVLAFFVLRVMNSRLTKTLDSGSSSRIARVIVAIIVVAIILAAGTASVDYWTEKAQPPEPTATTDVVAVAREIRARTLAGDAADRWVEFYYDPDPVLRLAVGRFPEAADKMTHDGYTGDLSVMEATVGVDPALVLCRIDKPGEAMRFIGDEAETYRVNLKGWGLQGMLDSGTEIELERDPASGRAVLAVVIYRLPPMAVGNGEPVDYVYWRAAYVVVRKFSPVGYGETARPVWKVTGATIIRIP